MVPVCSKLASNGASIGRSSAGGMERRQLIPVRHRALKIYCREHALAEDWTISRGLLQPLQLSDSLTH